MKTGHKVRIKKHLEEYGSITTNEAFTRYGITRLSEYIRELREQGFNIETQMCEGRNRYGEKVRYGVYRLKP